MDLSLNIRIAWTLAIVALASGVFFSFSTGDWNWLSRAGCLVVVIGILRTSSQILEHNRYLRRHRPATGWIDPSRGDAIPNRSSHDWADVEDMKAMAHARGSEHEAWELESHGLYLLITGTLVWGFGDLPGLLI